MSEDEINLGACCYCGKSHGVTNIVMIDKRAPVPGCGWGCIVCGLPPDGAVAVMCDGCVGQTPRFVCRGYPSSGDRVAYEKLSPDKFEHDASIEH